MDFQYVFKYIIVGDSNVGKTSIISSLIFNTFKSEYSTTIGVDFSTKMLEVDDMIVKLQLWDTAGQESFRSITKCYYRGAIGAIVVFDLTNKHSFDNVVYWFNDIINSDREEKTQILLIGNKNDLEQKVSNKDIENLLKEYENIQYIETNSYDNDKIKECFKVLTRQVIKNLDKSRLDTFGYGAKKIKLEYSETQNKYSKYSCC